MEIDGGYHCSKKQISKDRWHERYLVARKCRVIRITNDVAMKITINELRKLVFTKRILRID